MIPYLKTTKVGEESRRIPKVNPDFHVSTHTYTHSVTDTHVRIHMQPHLHMHTYTYTACTHMHTCTSMITHVRTCIFTQTPPICPCPEAHTATEDDAKLPDVTLAELL